MAATPGGAWRIPRSSKSLGSGLFDRACSRVLVRSLIGEMGAVSMNSSGASAIVETMSFLDEKIGRLSDVLCVVYF